MLVVVVLLLTSSIGFILPGTTSPVKMFPGRSLPAPLIINVTSTDTVPLESLGSHSKAKNQGAVTEYPLKNPSKNLFLMLKENNSGDRQSSGKSMTVAERTIYFNEEENEAMMRNNVSISKQKPQFTNKPSPIVKSFENDIVKKKLYSEELNGLTKNEAKEKLRKKINIDPDNKRYSIRHLSSIANAKDTGEVKILNLNREIKKIILEYLKNHSNTMQLLPLDYDSLFTNTNEEKVNLKNRYRYLRDTSRNLNNCFENSTLKENVLNKVNSDLTYVDDNFLDKDYQECFNNIQRNTSIVSNKTDSQKDTTIHAPLPIMKSNQYQVGILTDHAHKPKEIKEGEHVTNYGVEFHFTPTEIPVLGTKSPDIRSVDALAKFSVKDSDVKVAKSILYPVYRMKNTTKLIHILRPKIEPNPDSVGPEEIRKGNIFSNIVSQLNSNNFSIELSSESQYKDLSNISDGSNYILEITEKLKEERRKNVQYTNFINSILGKEYFNALSEGGGSLMQSDRQDNGLAELKHLMLDYFESLNFDVGELNGNRNTTVSQTIMDTTNIFELMNQSSKLVKLNLEEKQAKSEKDSGFVKTIVEKQIEKCKVLFNTTKSEGFKQNSTVLFSKQIYYKIFLIFTKCVDYRLERCLIEFSLWLERRKFYERPKFQLVRAYQNYERAKNLYCIRTVS